jgi:hypothetical protein
MRCLRQTLALVALALASVVALPITAESAAAASSRAVVVVDTGSGVHAQVIEFSGSVSGMQALQLAGAAPETIRYGDLGDAVCRLYGVGDAPTPSECPGGWSYYRAVGGAGTWNTSGLGASNTSVHDGDVEGWKYGGGRPAASAVFCDYVACAAPAPDPAPSGGGQDTSPSATPQVGGAPSAPGASGNAATGGATPGSDPAVSTDEGIVVGGETATTSTTSPRARTRATKDDGTGRETALGARNGGDDGGSGSPLGVAIVAAVLVVVAAVALVGRRRRSGGPPAGTA